MQLCRRTDHVETRSPPYVVEPIVAGVTRTSRGARRSGSVQGHAGWCSDAAGRILESSPTKGRDDHHRHPHLVHQRAPPQPRGSNPRRRRGRARTLLRPVPHVLPDRLRDPDARRRSRDPDLRRRSARHPRRGPHRLDRLRGAETPSRPPLAPRRGRPRGDRRRLARRAGRLLAEQRLRVDAAPARRRRDRDRAAARERRRAGARDRHRGPRSPAALALPAGVRPPARRHRRTRAARGNGYRRPMDDRARRGRDRDRRRRGRRSVSPPAHRRARGRRDHPRDARGHGLRHRRPARRADRRPHVPPVRDCSTSSAPTTSRSAA